MTSEMLSPVPVKDIKRSGRTPSIDSTDRFGLSYVQFLHSVLDCEKTTKDDPNFQGTPALSKVS